MYIGSRKLLLNPLPRVNPSSNSMKRCSGRTRSSVVAFVTVTSGTSAYRTETLPRSLLTTEPERRRSKPNRAPLTPCRRSVRQGESVGRFHQLWDGLGGLRMMSRCDAPSALKHRVSLQGPGVPIIGCACTKATAVPRRFF